MQKSFQRKSFNRWLSRNKRLFLCPPVIVKNRRKYFTFRFRGIKAAVECTITSNGYSINVSHKGEIWDLIDVGDLSERRASSGQYFCELCKPEYRELLPTRYALWENHVFEQILNWANHNHLKTKWVCLFQYGQGATMAQVVDVLNVTFFDQENGTFCQINLHRFRYCQDK